MKILFSTLLLTVTLLSTIVNTVTASECDSIVSFLNTAGITKHYRVACNKSGDLETL